MVTADDSAERAAVLMRDENVGFLPVVRDEDSRTLIGVLTDRDLMLTVVAENRLPREVPIAEIMTPVAISVHPDDELDAVERKLADAEVHRLPVVDDAGHVVGVVSLNDLAQVEDDERTGALLREASRPWAQT